MLEFRWNLLTSIQSETLELSSAYVQPSMWVASMNLSNQKTIYDLWIRNDVILIGFSIQLDFDLGKLINSNANVCSFSCRNHFNVKNTIYNNKQCVFISTVKSISFSSDIISKVADVEIDIRNLSSGFCRIGNIGTIWQFPTRFRIGFCVESRKVTLLNVLKLCTHTHTHTSWIGC